MKFYRKCLAADESNPKKKKKERGFVIPLLMQVYISH